MRYEPTIYPVDRYMVESSKKIDIINIVNDDIWNPEPALRPEDEIILRKLHDMLQSTADDLKLLSGELSKYHEPGVQKKSLPTPLDQEFNEKVHIEEIVKAKFYGHKIIDNIKPIRRNEITTDGFGKGSNSDSIKKLTNANTKVNPRPLVKQTKKNLTISGTKTIQIAGTPSSEINSNQKNMENKNVQQNKPSKVSYTEFSYKHTEPTPQNTPQKPLQLQELPGISIRSQLKEQKVLQLDILPDTAENQENVSGRSNALVIEMKHESPKLQTSKPVVGFDHINLVSNLSKEPTKRKISIIPAYESSESSNNISSETQRILRIQKQKHVSIRSPTNPHLKLKNKKGTDSKKSIKNSPSDLIEWNRRLTSVYGGTSKQSPKKGLVKETNKKCSEEQTSTTKGFNNKEYIPYSKLTLGGVSVRDIEREISNVPNRNDVVLSPILDKILSSRENSFHKDSKDKNTKILTTSDENLLEEVLDIEKNITETLSVKNTNLNEQSNGSLSDSSKDNGSYDDDFEDMKTDESENGDEGNKSQQNRSSPNNSNYESENKNHSQEDKQNTKNIHKKIIKKVSNLSMKNKIDIFEYIHSVNTQDTATQSSTTSKINPKETQTSPRNDTVNVQPIRNDLWSIDPRGEIEKLFKLEKDFIKKVIIDEYGDILEKNISKPSTSKDVVVGNDKNETASQKNTQTSPAHVKSIMTSPTRTKTRTTSPFALSLTVNTQTSPIIHSNEEELNVEIRKDDDDLGISVNLSSPRFSLRLPQSTRDVLSNFERHTHRVATPQNKLRQNASSSSSIAEDYSSSDISSLGEIHRKYKRKIRKLKIPSISELSTSSSRSSTERSAILPLRSEDSSLGQIKRKQSNKISKSEGEISLGQLRW